MVKQDALECIHLLPDSADWDDIFYSLYVIQKIEKGRKGAREEKGLSVAEARKLFGNV